MCKEYIVKLTKLHHTLRTVVLRDCEYLTQQRSYVTDKNCHKRIFVNILLTLSV